MFTVTRSSLLQMVSGFLVLAAGNTALHAQRSTPLPPLSGTSVTLATSSQRVVTHPLRTDSPAPVLGTLVTLRNNARQPATFTFADLELAHTKFTFSLFNSENSLIWTGPGTPTKRSPFPQTPSLNLAARSSWQVAARVPLTTDGTWLPVGIYRLEATLNGTPITFAAASFEIVAAPAAPTTGSSGIMGLVLAPTSSPSDRTHTPAANASVTIEPAKRPASTTTQFTFQGQTDAAGRFDAKLPPGAYRVRVSWSPPQSQSVQDSNQTQMHAVAPITATSTITVPKGRMAPLTLELFAPTPVFPVQPRNSTVLSADEVSAMIILAEDGSKKIRIQATGTVSHPGYRNARLVTPLVVPAIAATEGTILFLQMVTDTPDPNLMFPQVISSVSAEVTLPYNDEAQVWIFSRGNTATASVRTSPPSQQAPSMP